MNFKCRLERRNNGIWINSFVIYIAKFGYITLRLEEGKKWDVEFISYKEMSYVRDKVWNKEEKI